MEKSEITKTTQEDIPSPHQVLDKYLVIQPNSVTYARYEFTAVQQNVLVTLMSAIQKFMNKDSAFMEKYKEQIEDQEKTNIQKKGKSIDNNKFVIFFDLFNNPNVRINIHDVIKESSNNKKKYLMQQLIEMSKKRFEFAYTTHSGKSEKVNTSLIGAIRNLENSNYIDIEIQRWALPYLVYYGKGVGGTFYDGQMAIALESIYAKRMYFMLQRWLDVGGFSMKLNEFKKILEIGDKYERDALLKEKVLNTAKKELTEKCDIGFEYTLYKNQKTKEKYLVFKVFNRKISREDYAAFSVVYHHLNLVFPHTYSSKALDVTGEILEQGLIQMARMKFERLINEMKEFQKTEKDVINVTIHILMTDFNVSMDNDNIVKKKRKKTGENADIDVESVKQIDMDLSQFKPNLSPHWRD